MLEVDAIQRGARVGLQPLHQPELRVRRGQPRIPHVPQIRRIAWLRVRNDRQQHVGRGADLPHAVEIGRAQLFRRRGWDSDARVHRRRLEVIERALQRRRQLGQRRLARGAIGDRGDVDGTVQLVAQRVRVVAPIRQELQAVALEMDVFERAEADPAEHEREERQQEQDAYELGLDRGPRAYDAALQPAGGTRLRCVEQPGVDHRQERRERGQEVEDVLVRPACQGQEVGPG